MLKNDLARGPAKGKPAENFTGNTALDPENYTGEPEKMVVGVDMASGRDWSAQFGMLIDKESGSYVIRWDGEKILSVGKKMGSKKRPESVLEIAEA